MSDNPLEEVKRLFSEPIARPVEYLLGRRDDKAMLLTTIPNCREQRDASGKPTGHLEVNMGGGYFGENWRPLYLSPFVDPNEIVLIYADRGKWRIP